MYTLFNTPTNHNRGRIQFAEMNYVRQGLQREIEKFVTYYRENVFHLNNAHPLVSIVQSFNVQYYENYQKYVAVVADQTDKMATSIGFTSPIYPGRLQNKSIFYGPDVSEVLISASEYFDIDDAVKNWQDLRPIRVISHPFMDMAMPHLRDLYKPYTSMTPGISVILVNFPMLMLQYRRWMEVVGSRSTDSSRTANQFMAMYPITNMVHSHIDVAFFNRLTAAFNGQDLTVATPKLHPFTLITYYDRMDYVINNLLKELDNNTQTFDNIVDFIPSITNITLRETLMLPQVAKTRQIVWALILARLPLMRFLLRLSEKSSNRQNYFYLAKIALSLKEIRSDGSFFHTLPQVVKDQINYELEKGIGAYVSMA